MSNNTSSLLATDVCLSRRRCTGRVIVYQLLKSPLGKHLTFAARHQLTVARLST